jgi:hypothetical protein
LEALREKTRAFRECLNEEEAQSNKMRRNWEIWEPIYYELELSSSPS